MKHLSFFLFTLSVFFGLSFVSCTKQNNTKNIAVFIPGVMANSPTYALLDEGVRQAIDEYNQTLNDENQVTVFTMEAGTNQAEWGEKLALLAAQKKYDVIISSNSSLPELALTVLEQFPSQKFIFLDAKLKDNKNIYTAAYNQYEQAFLSGYSAGLMSKNHKVAMVVAQHYPVMDNIIIPFFTLGAQSAYNDTQFDFRVVGNWYDANQGALLADALIANGTDVILPICGGAALGVINSAVNSNTYICWFDSNGFNYAPGTVISSSTMNQKELSALLTKQYLQGKTKWGEAEEFGMKDGYVDFIQEDPLYRSSVPQEVQEKMAELVENIKNGNFTINQDGFTK